MTESFCTGEVVEEALGMRINEARQGNVKSGKRNRNDGHGLESEKQMLKKSNEGLDSRGKKCIHAKQIDNTERAKGGVESLKRKR
jgi:hypothetical protein